jgi:hypothetical protein
VYDRKYGDQTVNFEASGGLMNASLVMQDRETDTYWSIMMGEAIAGELAGNKLIELPVGKKMKWQEWVELHPDTLVLSVNGRQDVPFNPYRDYFTNGEGFGGAKAKDKRLDTKESIYAFQYGGKKYAVPFEVIKEGRVFELENGLNVFLYRSKKSDLFQSTAGFVSNGAGFKRTEDGWTEASTGSRYHEDKAEFVGGSVARLNGFDTFWYTWSLSNPETEILR